MLAILFYDVFIEGVGVFSDRAESFLSGGLRSNAAASGVFQAIKGTFWIGVFVVVLSFPIGVASGGLPRGVRQPRVGSRGSST